MTQQNWKIFTGKQARTVKEEADSNHEPALVQRAETPRAANDPVERLINIDPPGWRQRRQQPFEADETTIELVNAALYLRRPLLVTGPPGTGKSSLAYAIADELKLAPILKWPINSRSTLTEGLYHYDAIARLRDANLEKPGDERRSEDIRRYLRL